MTRVLHIYPKNDSMTANYVAMLMQTMEGRAEAHATDDEQDARQWVAQREPDIIHQHGHVAWAFHRGLGDARRVLSPHGQPVDAKCQPYVAVARSPIEAKRLADTGLKRIETVANPLLTRTTRSETAADALLRIYQRVVNSDVRPRLSDATRLTMRLLLRVALCGDRQWAGTTELPENPQWQLLYNYAWHEGISGLIDRGLSLMGRQIPPHTTPVSYLPEGYVRPTPRPKASVAELTAEVISQMRRGRLQLLLLCDLHQALRRPTLDEEALLRQLKDEGLDDTFPCLLQLLSEELLLDEGYMPCPPTDNHTTARLRAGLENHLTL